MHQSILATDPWFKIRDRLMDKLGWTRKDATLAARFLKGAETIEDLRFRTSCRYDRLSLVRAYDIMALAHD